MNALAALWYHFDRLDPDAVVMGISSNDNHSSPTVLPNGSLWQGPRGVDELGDPHAMEYRMVWLDSFGYRRRWLQVGSALKET